MIIEKNIPYTMPLGRYNKGRKLKGGISMSWCLLEEEKCVKVKEEEAKRQGREPHGNEGEISSRRR